MVRVHNLRPTQGKMPRMILMRKLHDSHTYFSHDFGTKRVTYENPAWHFSLCRAELVGPASAKSGLVGYYN